MDITTDLIFEGEQFIEWIRENKETGLIDILFDSQGHEFNFSFEPNCFDAVIKAMNEFQEKGKFKPDPHFNKSRIKPDLVTLAIDNDKRVEIEPDLGDVQDENPFILIISGKSRFYLYFSEAQAKALIEVLKKIIEIKQLKRAVEKKKTVKS